MAKFEIFRGRKELSGGKKIWMVKFEKDDGDFFVYREFEKSIHIQCRNLEVEIRRYFTEVVCNFFRKGKDVYKGTTSFKIENSAK